MATSRKPTILPSLRAPRRRGTPIARRSVLGLLAGVASAGGLRPQRAFAEASWPTEPIAIVCSTGPGGGFDLMARTLAPALSHELGVPVNVIDKPGGAMVIGTNYFLSQPHDGNTLLVSGPSPYWYVDINKFHVRYKLADFDIFNIQWTDKTGVFVPVSGRLKSFREIVDTIKAKPGEISCGVVRNSGEYFNIGILLDALKLPYDAVRLVTYESSAPLRTAIAGNQLDFALVSLEGSVTMLTLMKPVAVFNGSRVPLIADTPTVDEVIKPDGITVNFVPSSMRCFATTADLQQKYPERRAKLFAAYQKVLQDADFRTKTAKLAIGADWLGPEKSLAAVQAAYAILDRYKELLNKL